MSSRTCLVSLPVPRRAPPSVRWLPRDNRGVRLTEGEARARLGAARVARLATAGSDGQPHVVPVTFAVDGDLICTAVDHKPKTTVNLRRLRNIRENPRVAVLTDHYAEDWDALWWVRVDGRANVLENDDRVRRQLDMLAERYEQYRQTRPTGPVILIEAERWTGWAGGPGRLPAGRLARAGGRRSVAAEDFAVRGDGF
jgi:PPOX class probable F420-dependent enzyme